MQEVMQETEAWSSDKRGEPERCEVVTRGPGASFKRELERVSKIVMGDQPRHEQIDERKYNKCEDVKTKGIFRGMGQREPCQLSLSR